MSSGCTFFCALLQFLATKLPLRLFKAGVCLYVAFFLTLTGFAQTPLSNRDKQIIEGQANDKLQKLESLLNLLSDKKNSQASIKKFYQNNTDPNNDNRIFENPDVRILNDFNPLYLDNGKGDKMAVKEYLSRPSLFYIPHQKNSIEFKLPRVIDIGQKEVIYVRIVYVSQFDGHHRGNNQPFPKMTRIADFNVTNKDGKWVTTVANIFFADKNEVALAYGNDKTVDLIIDLGDADIDLQAKLALAQNLVQQVLTDISDLKPDTDNSSLEISEETYKLALEYSKHSSTLALRSKGESEVIRGNLAISLDNKNEIDSLLRFSQKQVEIMEETVEANKRELEVIKKNSEKAQRFLSGAEINAALIDTLLASVPLKPKKEDSKKILQNYQKARNYAAYLEAAKDSVGKHRLLAAEAYKKIQNNITRSEEAQKQATLAHNEIEIKLGEIIAARERGTSANIKVQYYLQEADSVIRMVESLIRNVIRTGAVNEIEEQKLNIGKEETLFKLRTMAKEATELTSNLHDAAQFSKDEELIESSANVREFARQIQEISDGAAGTFDAAFVQNSISGNQSKSKYIKEILNTKQEALTAIRAARSQQFRNAHSIDLAKLDAGNAKQEIDEAREQKQKAAVNIAIHDYKLDGESHYSEVEETQRMANLMVRNADLEIKRAYQTVIKTSLKNRRHNALYLGVNYTFYQGSREELFTGNLHQKNDLSNFGLSLYGRIGGFVSHYGKLNDEIPDITEAELETFTDRYLANKELEFRTQQLPYTSLTIANDGARANLSTYSAGIYISPLPHFYLKAGLTHISGSTWDEATGNYPYGLPSIGNAPNGDLKKYVIHYNRWKTNDFLVGVALVWPYAQIEGGYNKAFKDYFMNIGLNIPLQKTFMFKKVDKIKKDEFTKLMNDWTTE